MAIRPLFVSNSSQLDQQLLRPQAGGTRRNYSNPISWQIAEANTGRSRVRF
jgi:hypothetical protein